MHGSLWKSIIDMCFKIAYRWDKELKSGERRWLAGFALVNPNSVPF